MSYTCIYADCSGQLVKSRDGEWYCGRCGANVTAATRRSPA